MGPITSEMAGPQPVVPKNPFAPIATKQYTQKPSAQPTPMVADLNLLKQLPNCKDRVALTDFIPLKTIGKGSFGKVLLVKKKIGGEFFALKILRKDEIIRGDQVEHTITEKNVLQQIEHPFIVNLRYAFQTEKKLFLVMDFANGGDLFFHLKKEGRFSEERCRLYAAEIILAFEAIHKKDIIYRDLKPENVLLGADGHIRLTDFGLSKTQINTQKMATTFCGTPEYLAPEMLRPGGYGKSVDWWALGAFLYEILVGLPPFYNNNQQIMFQNILSGEVQFPDFVSPDARDLLRKLLHREPRNRIGCQARGAADIKEHPFFASLNWDDVYNKKYTPTFIPEVAAPDDLANIDPEFTSMAPLDPDDGDEQGEFGVEDEEPANERENKAEKEENSRSANEKSGDAKEEGERNEEDDEEIEIREDHGDSGECGEDDENNEKRDDDDAASTGEFAGFSFTAADTIETQQKTAFFIHDAIAKCMNDELIPAPLLEADGALANSASSSSSSSSGSYSSTTSANSLTSVSPGGSPSTCSISPSTTPSEKKVAPVPPPSQPLALDGDLTKLDSSSSSTSSSSSSLSQSTSSPSSSSSSLLSSSNKADADNDDKSESDGEGGEGNGNEDESDFD
ncbi:putative serine/threonine kinase [Monocercomonoides exilis]|uniref:putative serine/threonine kinase n=1 Tax=Monocercomonoides exilis TaxID=2049356 RepID=UPI003559B51D|nr:putative serine/threonine kinase [Monocercomonoides exilis]|eukprot:MONOS_6971.1-p1 / transcript=MONOS_6971.1 / gene=MONOS_6971 / organism=Monocercomonoides_exilis_PA203 / gene_product=serine / transcript_product=serine / location=Mono_scaffold00229:46679-49491(-) / protein_length=622 / sequence_SO=supercontig / SO=protein_coding / is_pseudo=false